MRITPLDVRKQEFRRTVRGVDPDEVHAFLATVADEYEAVLTDNKQLREKVIELDEKVGEYRNMEKTLRDTLLTAERVMTEARQNARKEAELILRDAQLKASQATNNIELRVDALRAQLRELRGQRDSFLARLQSLAEAQVGLVESYRKDFTNDDDRSERLMRDPETGLSSSSHSPMPPVAESVPTVQADSASIASPIEPDRSVSALAPSTDESFNRSSDSAESGAGEAPSAPAWNAPEPSSTTPASESTFEESLDEWRGYAVGDAPSKGRPPVTPPTPRPDVSLTDVSVAPTPPTPPMPPAPVPTDQDEDEVQGAVDQVLAIHEESTEGSDPTPPTRTTSEREVQEGPPAFGGQSSGVVPTYSSPEPTDSMRMEEAAGSPGTFPAEGSSPWDGPDPRANDEITSEEASESGDGEHAPEGESRWSLSRFTRGLSGL